MIKYSFLLFTLALVGVAFDAASSYPWTSPPHFPQPHYRFDLNPLSTEQVELGRVLFYDPILSKDSSISCASCHSPYNAFAHVDHSLSHGIADRVGLRNAPALMNLAWQPLFMWDGAINQLDMQALAPISHPNEMDADLKSVVVRLRASTRYQALFRRAYTDNVITGERVLKALSQFQLTLVSAESRYDSVMRHQATFNAQQAKGYRLFGQHCQSCHPEPLFTNFRMANNGLPVDTSLNDLGRMAITGLAQDSLLFKVPTLRNVEYTFPYMHDGRFKKLSAVLQHYTQGIEHSPTLAPELQKPLVLTSDEKIDLIAFLKCLSDRRFIFDPAHAYPHDLLSEVGGH